MVVLWIFLGIFLLIGLLLALPLKIFLRYTPEDGFQYRVTYLLIPLADSRKEEKPAKTTKKPSAPPEKKKKDSSAVKTLLSFLGLEDISSAANAKKAIGEKGLIEVLHGVFAAVKSLLQRTGKLIGHGVFRRFDLRITVASDDPADAAQNYGMICAAAYPLLTFLQNHMKFRNPKTEIRCDFSAEQTQAAFDGLLVYRPWYAVTFLGGLIWQYIKRKGART